jgi:alpha-glucosidase
MLAVTTAASAQMLARPGWSGSGFNADPWWKHAVFYEAAPAPSAPADLKAITVKLDALHSIGVDAVILPVLDLPAQPAQPAVQHTTTATPDNAAVDDFDELVHQAGRRGIRILLTLYAPAAYADLSVPARFWLSRGVSGFRVVTAESVTQQDTQAIVQALRKITNGAVGGRIVISDLYPAASTAPSPPPGQRTRTATYRHAVRSSESTSAQLQIDSQLDHVRSPDAADIRLLLAQSLLAPDLLLDFSTVFVTAPVYSGPGRPSSAPVVRADPSFDRARAAILLTTHSAALIGANAIPGPAAGPNAIADWYRQLSMMHHDNSTLRFGSVTALDFDAQDALVWVSRQATITALTPPIVVACNLSGSTVHLSLTAPLKALNLRGTFLRTLLRTDDAMGPQDLDSVDLPAFAVYIGELRR